MLLTIGITTQAALGVFALSATGARAAGAGKPVLPPLSLERARYYRDHPTELAALLARLPVPRDGVGPIANPPQLEPMAGGIWTSVVATMPATGASAQHLMMDGSVLVHAGSSSNWYKLTPDASGSYATGTWSSVAPMSSTYAPLYFASQVLVDGRLIVNGGEYNLGADASTNLGAIYDPGANIWAPVAAPTGWTEIGDAQSVVLFNETYMLADCCTTAAAILNPRTMTWAATGTGKFDINDEEGWSLLPSGNVITADAYVDVGSCGRNTEKYKVLSGKWVTAGNAAVRLSDCDPSNEVGPQVLRPDGTVVMFSGKANGGIAGTAVYDSATGASVQGADIPAVNGANYTLKDAPAALLPNGKILFAASPSVYGQFPSPTHFFQYGPGNNIVEITNDPANAAYNPSFVYNMLVLPTGQVMLTDQSNVVQLYNPVGAVNPAWAPVITVFPSAITRGATYAITGRQLNGLSEAGAYGDDNQSATDFPLVRVTDSAQHVNYCTTTHETSRNIAINAVTTMNFVCPNRIATGAAGLVVVTNGIASAAKAVTIH